MLQTNDRRKTMPVCSPLALRLSVASPTWQSCRAGSAPRAHDLASTALDTARSYRSEVIDLCAADIIEMRLENVLSLVTRSSRERVFPSDPTACTAVAAPSENPLCRRVPAVVHGRIA